MIANSFFTQFTSDILGIPLITPSMPELTVYGAARLCSIHSKVKHHFSFSDGQTRRIEPEMDDHRKKRLLSTWRNAVKSVIDFAAKK